MNCLSSIRMGAAFVPIILAAPALANDNTCLATVSLEQLENRTDVFGTTFLDSSETNGTVVLGCAGNMGAFSYDLGIRDDDETDPDLRIRDLKIGQDVGGNGFLILGYHTINPDPTFGLQPLNLFGMNAEADRFIDRTFEREAAPMVRYEYFADDIVLAATATQNMRYDLDTSQFVGSVAMPIGNAFVQALYRYDEELEHGLGASFTTIFGDNFELFGSVFAQRGSGRFYHDDALTGTFTFRGPDDSPIQRSRLDADDVVVSAAIGGNFTFQNGNTLLLEVFQDGEGLDESEWDNYTDIVNFHRTMAPSPAAAAGNLGFDLEAIDSTNMQNYAFTRYRLEKGDTEFSLSALINLHDSSVRISPDVTHTLSDQSEVFATLDLNAGCSTCEFGIFPESTSIAIGFSRRF